MTDSTVFDAFLAKEQGIYDKFAAGQKLALEEGCKPDPFVAGNKGCFVLGLQPSSVLIRALYGFKDEAEGILGSSLVAYDMSMLHTTFSDYLLSDDFVPDAGRRHDVRDLFHQIQESMTTHDVRCTYDKIVFNQTTVIVRGVPNQAFLEMSEQIVEIGRLHNVELRLPWGGHVTAGRFVKECDAGSVAKFAALCEKYSALLPKFELPLHGYVFAELSARDGALSFIDLDS